MLTFIELLIGVVVIVGVARYIIKGYSARGLAPSALFKV